MVVETPSVAIWQHYFLLNMHMINTKVLLDDTVLKPIIKIIYLKL
jgi:hypothetical protein